MSRAGYSDDCDGWGLICYRGQVKSAIRGRRGQRFLRELRDALDALPEPKLCYHELQRQDGACCAIGALGRARGIDMTEMDPEDATESGELAEMFDIANQLVREVEFENDDWGIVQWYPAPVYEERVMVGQKKNDSGELVNRDGLTKAEFEDRADRKRWSRMRQWVDEQIRPESTEER